MFSAFKRQDWLLNGVVFALMAAGLAMSFSVSPDLFAQQAGWVILGIILIFLFSQIDWRALTTYRWMIVGLYLFGLLLLTVTYFFAPIIRNTRSWLVLGPVQFQVSELIKVIMIIFFAYYFARRHIGIAHLGNILRSLFFLLPPVAFIFFQPDMASVIVLVGLWIGFLLVSGLRWKHLGFGFLLVALLLVVACSGILKDYQKERIVGLFQPNYDPLGVNYSTIQSKIAIGSAGIFGKGFQRGTQVQLGFLPEAATDFVFAGFTEEWGLLGAFVLVGLFLIMIFRITRIGIRAENNFLRFVCLGTVIMFLIQFFINAGTAIGLVPVIGLTFPFLSYGGSSLLVNAILLGIVQSARVYQSVVSDKGRGIAFL